MRSCFKASSSFLSGTALSGRKETSPLPPATMFLPLSVERTDRTSHSPLSHPDVCWGNIHTPLYRFCLHRRRGESWSLMVPAHKKFMNTLPTFSFTSCSTSTQPWGLLTQPAYELGIGDTDTFTLLSCSCIHKYASNWPFLALPGSGVKQGRFEKVE